MISNAASIKQISDTCNYSIAEGACRILTIIHKNADFAVAKTGPDSGILFGPHGTDTRLVKLIINSLDMGDKNGYDRCYAKYKDIIESFFDARHDILKEEESANV